MEKRADALLDRLQLVVVESLRQWWREVGVRAGCLAAVQRRRPPHVVPGGQRDPDRPGCRRPHTPAEGEPTRHEDHRYPPTLLTERRENGKGASRDRRLTASPRCPRHAIPRALDGLGRAVHRSLDPREDR